VAARLAELGWGLRTGGAPGMDRAFEEGARKAGGRVEVFLPWSGYEGYTAEAYRVAAEHHPAWEKLGRGVRALMARNPHQVLGPDLGDPVAFLVCWTPDGAEEKTGPETGGTGQAIRLAVAKGIPVFNLAREGALERLGEFVRRQGG